MSAFEKEKIFVELRKYHTDEFPKKMSTEKMEKLHTDFVELEDHVVNMILSLVNGKVAFVDLTKEITTFTNLVKIKPAGDRAEDKDRTFFLSKIKQLLAILNIAKESTFKLRLPRGVKATQA